MNGWTLGVDTSHWSGDINFQRMYDGGARFWITKATDANKYTGYQFEDSRFDGYVQAASKTSLLKGCYHWLQASVDPTIAADFYLERYNRYEMEFPPILDFEEPSVRDTGKFSDYAWRAQVWCKRCEDVTGRKPIIYTARWFTNYFKTEYLSWMRDYPLWVASYPYIMTALSKPYMPVGIWDDWTMWQFSATGYGDVYGVQAASIDRNYFKGDYAELLDFLGKVETPTLTLEERVERLEKEVFG
jgi:lysozyme